ncbi:hypothetical protein [Mesorhizobium sp. A623]
MDNEDSVAAAARRISAATMAKISPPPPPEEVFADWLVALPHDACIEAAAAGEIARIDQRNLLHPGVQRLRTLLVAVAGKASWTRPVVNR